MEPDDRIFDIKVSPEALRLAGIYGLPPYMMERFMNIFEGEELYRFLDAIEREPPRTIRCNTIRLNDCGVLEKSLSKRGYVLRVSRFFPYVYHVLKAPGALGGTIEYLLGHYYIQGLGSIFAAELLSPRGSDIVADLAAAPGGKTTHLSQLMGNKGCILAVDRSPRRLVKLINNLRRMGVTNTVVARADVLELSGLGNTFDKILLDAPCTGEGLLVFKRERRYTKTLEDLRRMSEIQYSLLLKAAEMLKPGGRLLYATCSMAPEENEYVIHRLLSSTSDIEPVETRHGDAGTNGITHYMGFEFDERLGRCMRLYPHRDGTEGFFYCLLTKTRS